MHMITAMTTAMNESTITIKTRTRPRVVGAHDRFIAMCQYKDALITTAVHCYGCKTTFTFTSHDEVTSNSGDAPRAMIVWRVVCMGCLSGSGMSTVDWKDHVPTTDQVMLTIGHCIPDECEVNFAVPSMYLTSNDIMSMIPINSRVESMKMSMDTRPITDFITNRYVCTDVVLDKATSNDSDGVEIEPGYVNIVPVRDPNRPVTQIAM